ncbi:hypothetical protein KIH86_26170 [Paenibacillus sp. HN-1]|uniref:hypothetical protein n=1 Tax=Paenibacillus TaxID=44249 RepID=UPI001CA8C96A|nr:MULTISPECIES: hypothetical protein [Paenibacillus]MBY9081556.1 hypothetical protein [Paenibacillus sp. CGMCC 1.18879]MBY9087679.1 hypothetical protein [Paenibacillus sinensis]
MIQHNKHRQEKDKLKRILGLGMKFLLLAALVSGLGAGTASAEEAVKPEAKVVLDPGFGYQSLWKQLAGKLYAESKVKPYLPTRLPDAGLSYYGIASKLTSDGYEIQLFKSGVKPSSASTLPGASAFRASGDTLLETSASPYSGVMPRGSVKLLTKNGWTVYADEAAAGTSSSKQKLVQFWSQAFKFATPLSKDVTGTILISGSGVKAVYSAYWTFDQATGYTLSARTSLSDFLSVLTSCRPVINLLDQADVVLIPYEDELAFRLGTSSALNKRENEKVKLSAAPLVSGSVPYFPLKDAVTFIHGEMQSVPSEHSVYFSENGYVNESKLDVKTGAVYRKNEKVDSIKILRSGGTILVPLSFLQRQFKISYSFDAASGSGALRYSNWFTNYKQPTVTGSSLQVTLLGTGGFSYENSRFGAFDSYSYESTSPPQGYNGLKYALYKVSIPLLPGDNEFVYRDAITGRIINSIPIQADLKAADIDFRYTGSPSFDGWKLDLSLVTPDGTVWPAGYAETESYAELRGTLTNAASGVTGLLLTTRPAGGRESKAVSAPLAKDGSFSARIKPEEGTGTYIVTLYSPYWANINAKEPIVSFTVVVK